LAQLIERLGILGDIHAEDVRLGAAIHYLTALGVDRMVATGDIVDGYGDVDACCTLLKEHSILAVRGNHERWLEGGKMRQLPNATLPATLHARSAEYLAMLPTTAQFDTAIGQLLLCHGTGDDDMAAVRPDDVGYALNSNTALQQILSHSAFNVLLSGHTHRRMLRTLSQPRRLLLINAGTLFREHDPCFGLVDFGSQQATYFDIENPHAIRAMDQFSFA
jgi:predicted phosphodiesterase